MKANVRFDVISDRTYRPVTGEFVVRLACRMSVSDLAEPMPLSLCLLIDKSLSMRGAKIEAARDAAKRLINGMRDGDTLTIISFGTNIEVLADRVSISAITRGELNQTVEDLEAGGVTRMDLALEKALQLLGDKEGVLPMVLLLSDGAPTNQAGYVLEDESCEAFKNTFSAAFAKQAVISSTIGLGDAEACLAPFLESCAEAGGGVFYHEDDPENLAARFVEEFDRVKETAVSEARFEVDNVQGRIRRAAAVQPEIRDLSQSQDDDGKIVLEAGALQRGEEHIFVLEVVTPEQAEGKLQLCDIQVSYKAEGETHTVQAPPKFVEYTNDEVLLSKPAHPDVTRYKDMYAAFFQTRKAVENMRDGGDPKKTRALLQNASKTTRRLGLAKQTKLLVDLDQQLEQEGSLNENQLTAATTGSRKTRVLSRQ